MAKQKPSETLITFHKEQIERLPELEGVKTGDSLNIGATVIKGSPDSMEIRIESVSVESVEPEPENPEETDEEKTVSKMHSRRKNW